MEMGEVSTNNKYPTHPKLMQLGGPNPAMLEKVSTEILVVLNVQLERLSAVSERNPDVPSIKTGSPIDFFENLLHKTEGGKVLPTWRGELYLELHRGVS